MLKSYKRFVRINYITQKTNQHDPLYDSSLGKNEKSFYDFYGFIAVIPFLVLECQSYQNIYQVHFSLFYLFKKNNYNNLIKKCFQIIVGTIYWNLNNS